MGASLEYLVLDVQLIVPHLLNLQVRPQGLTATILSRHPNTQILVKNYLEKLYDIFSLGCPPGLFSMVQ